MRRADIIEPCVSTRLSALRARLNDLEWDGQDDTTEAARIRSEIKYLKGYEALGIIHEPSF